MHVRLGRSTLLVTAGLVAAVSLAAVPALAGSQTPNQATAPVIELGPFARQERAAVADRSAAPTVAEPDGLTSTIAVTVVPGPLTVLTAPSTVHLERVPGASTYRGFVDGVRVVDARGGNAGWSFSMTLPDLDRDARVTASVQKVVAMAVSTDGLHAERRTTARSTASLLLVHAARGTGAGSFNVTFALEVSMPGEHGDRVAIPLTFSVV